MEIKVTSYYAVKIQNNQTQNPFLVKIENLAFYNKTLCFKVMRDYSNSSPQMEVSF